MEDFKGISRIMERIIHKYNQVEKISRTYGSDIPLTRSEIHTIAVIGDTPDINVTSLAKLRGVTKGAASQMVYKLVEKGLVEKRVSPNSDSEVCLSLTKTGLTAHNAHSEYHKNSDEEFFKLFREMPKDHEKYVLKMLNAFDKALDERLK